MFESVLIAVDGSDEAGRAAALGVEVAAVFGSRLTFLCVIDVRVVEGPAVETLAPLWGEVTGRPFQPEVLRLYRERAEATVADASTRARERGLEASTLVEIGVAEDTILERAREADLLVLGRRGEHGGSGRRGVGATVWRILHRSVSPVLVAAPGAAGAGLPLPALPRLPLIAWDASPGGQKALALGIEYARTAGGELRLVHAGGEEADERMQEAVSALARSGIPWEGARLDSGAAEAVAEAARRWETDCVFMGAFGRGRLRDFFFGSHTVEILDAVSLPLFVTP